MASMQSGRAKGWKGFSSWPGWEVVEISIFIRQLALFTSVMGLAAFPIRSQTNPPFSIQQRAESSWLVNPNGQKFFSLGVCVVNQGHSSTTFNPTNPGYAAFQHYADSNRWAKATVQRLKKWHFTTIGG